MNDPLRPTRDRVGFTLLELMIVVIILAIVMTIAVPRFSGADRRVFNNTADQVGDLLLMFAQRDTLGRQTVGIRLDGRRLSLVMLDEEWRPDPFVPAVTLPDLVDIDSLRVYADNEAVDIVDWPLTHTPGEDRPNIEVEMHSHDGLHRTTLILAPHALAARRVDDRSNSGARMAVDLDAAGRSREDW